MSYRAHDRLTLEVDLVGETLTSLTPLRTVSLVISGGHIVCYRNYETRKILDKNLFRRYSSAVELYSLVSARVSHPLILLGIGRSRRKIILVCVPGSAG